MLIVCCLSACQLTKQAAGVIKVCILSDRVIKLGKDFKNSDIVYLHWFYILDIPLYFKYTSVLIFYVTVTDVFPR